MHVVGIQIEANNQGYKKKIKLYFQDTPFKFYKRKTAYFEEKQQFFITLGSMRHGLPFSD